MNSRMSENLDWSRSKSASSVKQRGNMSLIAATIIKNGELVTPSARQRFIWPSGLEESSKRVLTRRVWGQYK